MFFHKIAVLWELLSVKHIAVRLIKSWRLAGTCLHTLRCCCVLQQECYKVMHSLLVHTDTREATMDYLTQVLLRNSKRAQIQASISLVWA